MTGIQRIIDGYQELYDYDGAIVADWNPMEGYEPGDLVLYRGDIWEAEEQPGDEVLFWVRVGSYDNLPALYERQ